MPMPLRPAAVLTQACLLAALLGCAQVEPMPRDPQARLFARALDQIDELYIVPVTNRVLALGAAARLSRFDPKLHVTEAPGPREQSETVLTYNDREVASYPSPQQDDPHLWGAWLGKLESDAKQASSIIAGLTKDELDKALFDGITGELDRFSRYSTPQVARDQRAARDGFGGVGVLLEDDAHPYRITRVMPGSPAALAGIAVGDRLVAIDGEATEGRSQNEVLRQLRGPVASAVTIEIAHPGAATRSVQLQRSFIVLPTVTMTRADGVLVFHISGFNQNTTQQLVADLEAAEHDLGPQLRGVVLDLRGDPGGLLDQSVSLADVFISKGPIVAAVGRAPASRQYFEASGDAIAPRLPVVVLINGGSASAAEILAAALQDSGRAVVVGTSSYGKGTVQTVLRLPNDGELILTWAELIAPAGYSLNGHGVVPTVCTSDLGNDVQALETALARAADPAARNPLVVTPRAELDQNGWTALRRACPPRRGDRPIDLAVAERVLSDPVLYARASHVMEPSPSLAAKPVGTAPAAAAHALTQGYGSLSSSEH
jgi:carboxyl-terminal processing protease